MDGDDGVHAQTPRRGEVGTFRVHKTKRIVGSFGGEMEYTLESTIGKFPRGEILNVLTEVQQYTTTGDGAEREHAAEAEREAVFLRGRDRLVGVRFVFVEFVFGTRLCGWRFVHVYGLMLELSKSQWLWMLTGMSCHVTHCVVQC